MGERERGVQPTCFSDKVNAPRNLASDSTRHGTMCLTCSYVNKDGFRMMSLALILLIPICSRMSAP
jgi:hypothetical protein